MYEWLRPTNSAVGSLPLDSLFRDLSGIFRILTPLGHKREHLGHRRPWVAPLHTVQATLKSSKSQFSGASRMFSDGNPDERRLSPLRNFAAALHRVCPSSGTSLLGFNRSCRSDRNIKIVRRGLSVNEPGGTDETRSASTLKQWLSTPT